LLANNEINICLAGRVEKNFPSYKQALVNSVTLAVDNSKLKDQVHIHDFFYDDRPLSPIVAYKKMIDNGCSAIIGYEYLSDLLLIEKFQQDKKIPIFTSYASGLDNEGFEKNIFIFRPSYNELSEKMTKFLLDKYGVLESVLLVTQISRDSMKDYKSAYMNQFKQQGINYDSFDFVENDIDLKDNINEYIISQQKKYQYIFLLSGAIDSARVANAIEDNNIVYIGTENFGSSSAASFHIRLSDKKTKSFFIRNLDYVDANEKLQTFSDFYKKTYDKLPLIISAYAYDATNIILESYKNFGDVSIPDINKVEYEGVTGIQVHEGNFYASKKHVILKSTDLGYEKSED